MGIPSEFLKVSEEATQELLKEGWLEERGFGQDREMKLSMKSKVFLTVIIITLQNRTPYI